MNFNQIKHGQDFSKIASTVFKVKVKVVSIGLSPTINFFGSIDVLMSVTNDQKC